MNQGHQSVYVSSHLRSLLGRYCPVSQVLQQLEEKCPGLFMCGEGVPQERFLADASCY